VSANDSPAVMPNTFLVRHNKTALPIENMNSVHDINSATQQAAKLDPSEGGGPVQDAKCSPSEDNNPIQDAKRSPSEDNGPIQESKSSDNDATSSVQWCPCAVGDCTCLAQKAKSNGSEHKMVDLSSDNDCDETALAQLGKTTLTKCKALKVVRIAFGNKVFSKECKI